MAGPAKAEGEDQPHAEDASSYDADLTSADDTLPRPAPERPGSDFREVDPDSYDLEHEFARGGLGRILRARDRRLRRHVAVKELISKDPKAEQRFVREALITARLEHPSIVPIHEAGRWPSGKRFYAMKLVEGRTLAEALDAAETREERLALLPHLIDVADAVAYAHSQGILHRDLKPGNVMVGPFGETVVIDWGLAKDLYSDQPASDSDHGPSPDVLKTSHGMVVGTPPYMPPEQAAAHDVNQRSDVYALGAMLYHCLCGKRPYQEVRSKDILVAVVSGPPRPLRNLAPDIPPELIAIADKAMARRPEERYPSAKEMAEELRRFTAGKLVDAHRYSFLEICSRFIRRNAAAVGIATAAALLLAGTGVVSYQRVIRERNAAQAAEAETAARNRALKLSQARLQLDRDPTMSLAWLKELKEPVQGAASVAAEAVSRGVATDVVTGFRREVDAVAVSPSARWIAAGDRAGGVRILDAQTRRVETLAGHDDRVTALAFSADETWLASAGYDDVLHLWNLGDGSSRVLTGHRGDVKGVVFLADGSLVSVGADRTIRRWSSDGSELSTREFERADRLLAIVAGPDGSLVTGGHAGRVAFWPRADAPPRFLDCAPRGEVTAFALSSDGRHLVCGGRSGIVRVFDLSDETFRELEGHEVEIETLAVSSDGREMISTDVRGRVARWRLADGAARWLDGMRTRFTSAAFSDDGDSLALGGWDGSVRLFGGPNGAPRTLRGHDGRIAGLAFVGGAERLATVAWDKQLRLWSIPRQSTTVLRGHSVGVHAVDVTPDGRWVASGGHDDQVRIWNVETGEARVLYGHEDHVFRVRFSPDGALLASSSDDRTVRLWETDGEGARVLLGHDADVEEIEFSPDGRWLASAGEDDRIWLWNVAGGTGRPLKTHRAPVTDVAFRPDSRRLASSGRDGRVVLWEVPGGQPTVVAELSSEVGSIEFSPDGGVLAAASLDGTVRTWDASTGELTWERSGFDDAAIVRFSPDGRYLAVGSRSTALWLCWRAYDRCDRLPDHRGELRDLAFDPSGRALVSAAAGKDDNLRIWDTRTEEYRRLQGHRYDVFSVAFFPSGDRIVSGSGDANVRLWATDLPVGPDELPDFLEQATTVEIDARALESPWVAE